MLHVCWWIIFLLLFCLCLLLCVTMQRHFVLQSASALTSTSYDAALWGDLLQQMLNLAMVSVSVLVRVCKEFQDPRKMCYCKLYSKAEYYNEKRLFGEERFLKIVLSVMVTGLHPPPRHIAVFMRLAQTMLLISPWALPGLTLSKHICSSLLWTLHTAMDC